MRARVRLALGGDVTVGDDLPARDGSRRFAARRGAESALVTVFPRSPAGPTPEDLRTIVDRFRATQHAALVLPRHAADIEGRACLVTVRPAAATALELLQRGAPIPVAQATRILRDVARALATLHRSGHAHGSLDLDTVHVIEGGAVVSDLGLRSDGSVAADLEALGRIGYALLAGDLPTAPPVPLARHRRAVPAELNRLIHALLDPDVLRRPASAEAVLYQLDSVPSRHPGSLASFLDGATHGARFPRSAGVRLLLAGLGVLLVAALINARA